ncbi:MAG: PKD domain-containing protein [Bacteroidetes bacterium]|nr:PKD domain-containing protein [Bacteroidota bacterium]
MKKTLQFAFGAMLIAAFTGNASAQSGIIAGDPIAYGETMPGIDLLAELTEAHANPKKYRSEENLDLDIIASARQIDISKGNEVEFSARSQWAENFVWKFGDGSTTSGFQHVKHRFPGPGHYEVTLLATNDKEVARQIISIEVIDSKATLELEEMKQYYVFPTNNKLEAEVTMNLPRKEKHMMLEMKDIAGTRIYQFEIGKVRRNQKIKVDLRDLEAGKYYAIFKGKRYSLVSKIIVAR